MYLIAIVEDEAAFRRQLTEYLTQYQDEHQGEFKVTEFSDGAEPLADYQPVYDEVLMFS